MGLAKSLSSKNFGYMVFLHVDWPKNANLYSHEQATMVLVTSEHMIQQINTQLYRMCY